MLERILAVIDEGREASLAGLMQFLRIPSVSTKPEHRQDMQRCAQWLAEQLHECDLSVEIAQTPGHPVVLAKSEREGDRPTVLVYGHYDVQPVEPLEQWKSPPFEPQVRDGALYARGSADDKGQVWAHVQAIRAWAQNGGLPVNVILLLEGEEEIGSDHLADFMRERRDELKADVAVISDTNQFARGTPAITYGLRGLVYMEVTITGPDHDLHSGLYGGAVLNPANELCRLLASLHDDEGRVAIPGFYDDVAALSDVEREAWRKLPFDESQMVRDLNVRALHGESGYSVTERQWARPTLDINGLTSGYQGHGAKTIIPSTASAKVSMRLVAHQDPRKIQAAFESTMRERCADAVNIEFKQHGLAEAVLTPMDGPAVTLAADALRSGFNAEPAFIRGGGSIPVVGLIKSLLGIDTLLVGFGLDDDRVHSPNEKFDLDALHNGTRTAAALYDKLAGLPRR